MGCAGAKEPELPPADAASPPRFLPAKQARKALRASGIVDATVAIEWLWLAADRDHALACQRVRVVAAANTMHLVALKFAATIGDAAAVAHVLAQGGVDVDDAAGAYPGTATALAEARGHAGIVKLLAAHTAPQENRGMTSSEGGAGGPVQVTIPSEGTAPIS